MVCSHSLWLHCWIWLKNRWILPFGWIVGILMNVCCSVNGNLFMQTREDCLACWLKDGGSPIVNARGVWRPHCCEKFAQNCHCQIHHTEKLSTLRTAFSPSSLLLALVLCWVWQGSCLHASQEGCQCHCAVCLPKGGAGPSCQS